MNHHDPFDQKQKEDYQYYLLYLPRGIQRLENLGELRSYPRNLELNEPWEIPDCCYLVKSGRVI